MKYARTQREHQSAQPQTHTETVTQRIMNTNILNIAHYASNIAQSEKEGDPRKRSIKINVDHVHEYILKTRKRRRRRKSLKERRNKLLTATAAAAEFKLIHLRVDNKPHYLFANSLIPIN